MDGTVFDSNTDGSFGFNLGQHQVIACWDENLAQMTVGENKTIQCTPDKAYGARGAGDKIPPNSALEFDVSLINCGSTNSLAEGEDEY